METKKIERVSYDEVYVAVDGLEFEQKDTCLKYEKTLACALRAKLVPMMIRSGSEDDIFYAGSCDNTTYVLLPKTPDDIVTIRQVAIGMSGGYGGYDHVTDEMIGQVVLLTIGYTSEWSSVVTLDSIVKCATNGQFKLAVDKSSKK